VQENEHELRELQLGEVLLPPQVRPDAWPHGRQQVVGVHDGVHEGVQEAHERDVATWGVVESVPHGHEHAAVVDHMEVRHLGQLSSQDEQRRIDKVQNLGKEIPVHDVGHPNSLVLVGIVAGLAPVVVVEEPANNPCLNEHVRGGADLEGVIGDHNLFQLHGFSSFH